MAGRNLFNSVKMTRPKNNVFDLTHDVKMSCNMGQLVPVMCMEAVPGDKFKIGAESLIRFAPMVAPPMHRMDVSIHYYFVPNRILWPNWEKFITNTPLESGALPAFPRLQMNAARCTSGSLADYLGVPTYEGGAGSFFNVSALPFAAYQKVWQEYYRDQNLIDNPEVSLIDGDNNPNWAVLGAMRRRAWEHDYFTAALPFAQKGEPVSIPIGRTNVILNPDRYEVDAHGEVYPADPDDHGNTYRMINPDSAMATNSPMEGLALTAPDMAGPMTLKEADGTRRFAVMDPSGTLVTEDQTESSINDLRRAYRLQEWLEKAARGGSRYIENILAHFGVKSSDKRLQRPEYITGVKSPVVISEILNTTGTDDLPQGNMSGHGVAVVSGHAGSYFCEEHGYIIGVMSIMPKTAYMQGLPKHFMKTEDPFQFFWPEFANIGEQEVINREVVAWGAPVGEGIEDTFGYVPRYAEYKFMNSRVAGDFRTNLDFWHMARKFDVANAPKLNQEFVECNPDDRIFAVTDPDVQKMYCHILNKITAVRPMPKYGTPTF